MNAVTKMSKPWLTTSLDGLQEGSPKLFSALLTKTLPLPSTVEPMKTVSDEAFSISVRKLCKMQCVNLRGLPLDIQDVEECPQNHHEKECQSLELQTTHPVRFPMCKNSACESTQARLDTHNEETFVWELSHPTNVSLQGICVNVCMGCFSEDDVVSAFNAVGKGCGARKGFFLLELMHVLVPGAAVGQD